RASWSGSCVRHATLPGPFREGPTMSTRRAGDLALPPGRRHYSCGTAPELDRLRITLPGGGRAPVTSFSVVRVIIPACGLLISPPPRGRDLPFRRRDWKVSATSYTTLVEGPTLRPPSAEHD